MTICWVTGADGQVGRSLRQQVEDQNNRNYLFLSRADLDITDHNAIKEMALKNPPECIINLAAFTDVNGAEDNPEAAHMVNATAVKHLASLAEKNNAVLIQISTDYVFDGTKTSPYLETDTTSPLNVYGKSKLQGEKYAQNICSKHLIIRTSWIFSEFGKNFVTTMIDLMSKHAPVRVVCDQLGGPTSAKALANVLYDLTSRKIKEQEVSCWGIFHFCQYPYTSWFDLCCTIRGLLINQQITCSLPVACSTAEFCQLAHRPTNSTLNCEKIERLGFPINSWIKDLRRVVILRTQVKHSDSTPK